MKKTFFLICFLLGILFSDNLIAQTPIERSKNITTIGGKEYYLHNVKAGQTLWGLSQAYNISVEEIEKLNPEVKKDGLKAGHVLGIPVRPLSEPKVEELVVEEPEPEPMPVSVEPEPVVTEPEPQPVVEEPKPEPEPVVVEPEPVIVEPVVEEPEPIIVVEPVPEPAVVKVGGRYTVQANED